MIEWERDGNTLRVTDVANAELAVHGDELVVDERGGELPRPVDETLVATAGRLRVPHAVVYAFSLETDERYELDPHGGSLTLPDDEYILDVDTEIKTYVRFSGRATITQTDGFESVVISFPERTRATIGFRSRHELPVNTITVPDRPDAVADAITHLAAAHRTTSPNRTYPTLRGHPSLLEPGDELDIPAGLRADCPDTGIELVVPPTYEALYVTAPLA